MSRKREEPTINFPEDPFRIGYICGLIDGEGCFNVTIFRSKKGPVCGFTVCPQFMIHITEKDRKILDFIQNTLNTGLVRFSTGNYGRLVKKLRNQDGFKYRITKVNDCLKLVEFLDGKLIVKQRDLTLWKKILKIIKEGKHLTKEGILEIAKIRDGMNNPSKSRKYKSYDWFKNFFSQY